MPSKLDLYLFIKSFELISQILYSKEKNKDTNESFKLFINKNLPIIIQNYDSYFYRESNRSTIKEMLKEIRSGQIVS